jgi:glutamate dehydrogenase
MNIDAQTAPLRIIGVGDMSGDVFGNGMLLSQNLRLIAAFDHRDIFIDPDPNPALSFSERKRLFELPNSSWQDYDRARLSPRGGVFSRTAKAIALTPEMRALLDLRETSLPPNELIQALLMAQADLLWFGGVGAFVRAAAETDVQAGDRANDAIRITADQLRVKVIGEGANLGMTQRARIEFAMRGGRINTDAIDNSAGVNCSDIEVNIKIALSGAMRKGALSAAGRNALLHEMTDDVAAACLRNNYLQSLALSLCERRGVSELGFQRRLMHELETRGLLDRELEALPGDVELASRRRRDASLTRPELAVLLAYAKMDLELALSASPLPDDPYMQRMLEAYFPGLLRQRFAAEIASCQLRREIIATSLANEMINRGGSTFVIRLAEETGSSALDVAYAFVAVMDIFDLDRLFAGVDALDNKIDGGRQLELYTRLQDLLWRQTAWFLRHGKVSAGLSDVIARYRMGLLAVRAALSDEGNAEDFSAIAALANGPDIVLTARRMGRSEEQIAKHYLGLGAYFRLEDLRAASERITHDDYFDRIALNSALDALADAWRSAVASLITQSDNAASGIAPNLEAWIASNSASARVKRGIDEILNGGVMTLAKLTVAVASLRDLTPNGSR